MKKPVAGTSHVARKRFGQNFLVDRGIVDAIVGAVRPQAGDQVVEIGPGLGALTEPLLRRVDHLHVVEIDRDIVARLKQRFPAGQLTIHEGDALKFDFGSLLRYPGDCLHVVGNLPYNISTPLLFHLANFAERVVDMHFMLQKEVVERMVAMPGTTDYGRLSVMLQYRFVIDWLIDVPPESFDPAPKVDSAVVRLIPRPPAELDAKDEVSVRNWMKGQLAVAGAIPVRVGGALRTYGKVTTQWTYQYRLARENMRRVELERQLWPFIDKYFPEHFKQGGQSSFSTWLTDLDRQVEDELGRPTDDFGDVLLSLEVTVPARAICPCSAARSST